MNRLQLDTSSLSMHVDTCSWLTSTNLANTHGIDTFLKSELRTPNDAMCTSDQTALQQLLQ